MLTQPWWQVLGVSPHASLQLIERAFIQRVITFGNPVELVRFRQALIAAMEARK